jgi:hypothetical protein
MPTDSRSSASAMAEAQRFVLEEASPIGSPHPHIERVSMTAARCKRPVSTRTFACIVPNIYFADNRQHVAPGGLWCGGGGCYHQRSGSSRRRLLPSAKLRTAGSRRNRLQTIPITKMIIQQARYSRLVDGGRQARRRRNSPTWVLLYCISGCGLFPVASRRAGCCCRFFVIVGFLSTMIIHSSIAPHRNASSCCCCGIEITRLCRGHEQHMERLPVPLAGRRRPLAAVVAGGTTATVKEDSCCYCCCSCLRFRATNNAAAATELPTPPPTIDSTMVSTTGSRSSSGFAL